MSRQITDLHVPVGPGTRKVPNAFPSTPTTKTAQTASENITDWALEQFRTHYEDDTITKWDIFHYNYGLLHHPAYREKYKANLKRDLPHIPYAKDFWGFAKAGERLATPPRQLRIPTRI